MPLEIELKLAIAPGDAARLRRHPLLKGLAARHDRLYGIYFDTPDHDLFKRRGAFRLRREGYHWVQTVKLDRGSVGGLSMRPEYDVKVVGNRPDFALLPDEARAALGPEVEARLAPVFATDFRRTVWHLERPRGTVEIALDLGHIRAGEADLPVAEVELELKAGDSAVIFELARELAGAVAMVPEYRSKALRGYGLLGVWREAPAKAAPAALDPAMAAAEAWRRLLLAGLEQLGHNLPGLIADDDPEYLHQARVAVRRLRTVLGLGRRLGLEQAAWVGELRWLMAEWSPARDWDVFVTETLARVRAGLPGPERLDGLEARAAEVRAAARRRARAAAASPRLAALMLDMGEALLAEGGGDGPTLAAWVREALDRRLKRFRVLARRFAELDAPGRHRVRIAAKRLRYAGESFAGLHGARAARYLERVARLQDDLGSANDVAVAQRLLAELAGAEAHAAGLAEGYLAAAAGLSGHLDRRVAALAKATPFWR